MYDDFQKLLITGLTEKPAMKKFGVKTESPKGLQNYDYLQFIWENEKMTAYSDFLQWHNNKYVVPILEAMQKTIGFIVTKG